MFWKKSFRQTADSDSAFLQVIDRLERNISDLQQKVGELERKLADKPWKQNILIPSAELYQRSDSDPFMQYSTCSAADFFHPRFAEISRLLDIPLSYHRKYWEWVFIVHIAIGQGVAGAGTRALGFGVGATEPIPAALARHGTLVTATDAPSSIGVGQGWIGGGEFATSVDALRHDGIVDKQTFLERVSFYECDMNDIQPQFQGYDFCWSSCCLEHLGNIQRGLDFIVNSVEKTLKIGGIACHTTEFNLSSNDGTVDSGPTVLFRKRDLEALIRQLRERGHTVGDLVIAPDSHHLDSYVDTPPYSEPPHLRLALLGYASTSMGIVIRRGR